MVTRHDESAEQLVAHTRGLRPDMVLTHDGHGGVTSHVDHVRTHQMVMRAVRESGQSSRVMLATHPDSSRSRLSGLIEERRLVHSVPTRRSHSLWMNWASLLGVEWYADGGGMSDTP